MHSSIVFALCVAVVAALYQVFQRQASGVNPYIVGIMVSAVAIVFGGVAMLSGGKISASDITQAKSAWIFLVLIGLCAFGIDFFTSKAYSAGGSVSVIGPIIICGVVLLTAIFGALFFKEPLTLIRVFGIALMIGGMFLASGNR